MVAGCGASCVKYLFFTFNFLVFICGAAILGISLWAIFDNNFQAEIKEIRDIKSSDSSTIDVNNIMIPLYILAAVGGLLLVCGFLGCCGACCESTCLLGLFFFVILLLFLAEIAGGIYIFVKKDDMKNDMRESFNKYVVNSDDEKVKASLETLEKKWTCCGAYGCGAGSFIKPTESTDKTNPLLNALESVRAGIEANLEKCCRQEIFREAPGCTDKLYNTLKNNVHIVAIVAVSLVVIELLAMIFSCILCNAIRNSAASYY